MKSIFTPAIALMNRLLYPQKFLLIGLLLLLPLALLMNQYLATINHDIDFSSKEQLGLEYNAPVVDLLAAVQRHGALASAYLTGNGYYYSLIQSNEAEIADLIQAIDAVDQRLGATLAVSHTWAAIRGEWEQLQADALSVSPDRSLEMHQQLSGALLALLTEVGNNSNLILDPDIDTYYLMDAVITKIPLVTEYYSQIRALGTAVAIADRVTAVEETRLIILSGLASSTLQASEAGYGYVFGETPALQGRLQDLIDDSRRSIGSFMGVVNIAIIEPRGIGASTPVVLDDQDYYESATEAIDKSYVLYDEVSAALNSLLQARIDGVAAQRNLVVVVALLALLATIYLFAGFYLAVQQAIAALDQASKRMVAGAHAGALVLDSRDELAQVAFAFNNVATEMLAARDRAIQANRLKDEFLATMSHELRTPLNSIIGFTGILLAGMRGEVDETAKGMLRRIKDSSHHLLNLINSVLDIAKIEAGRLELVSGPIVLRDMVSQWHAQMEVLAKQKNLQFEIALDPALPDQIMGDQDRITQIAINLLSNAFKFTDKGKVRLELQRADGMWQLRVIDTGVGIPPQALDYIFDEFRQVDGTAGRAYGGTGLGLAIVRKLCLSMGGRIQVSSTLGEGSAFTAILPLALERSGSAAVLAASRSVDYVS